MYFTWVSDYCTFVHILEEGFVAHPCVEFFATVD